MHVGLAKNHCACFFQFRYSGCIILRDAISKLLKCSSGPDSSRIIKILNSNGDTMQRTAPLTPLDLCFRKPGLLTGLVGDNRDERVESWVELFDAFEATFNNFDW